MAYDVNWTTGEVYIPSSDLVLISMGYYKLNMLDFRHEIRRLEWDGSQGLSYPPIIGHDSPKTMAGTTYAPFDEVLNPYTITFDPSINRVDLVGSNNNIIDVVNYNGVSVVPSNSAGSILVGDSGEDVNAPTWDTTTGITNAYQNNNNITITWGSASDTNEVRYNIYMSKFDTDVFNSNNLLTASQGHIHAIFSDVAEELQDATTYYIGVRAIDIAGNETDNTNYASVLYSVVESYATKSDVIQAANNAAFL